MMLILMPLYLQDKVTHAHAATCSSREFPGAHMLLQGAAYLEEQWLLHTAVETDTQC